MLRFVREGWHDIGQTLDNTLATSEIRNMYMDDLSTEQYESRLKSVFTSDRGHSWICTSVRLELLEQTYLFLSGIHRPNT